MVDAPDSDNEDEEDNEDDLEELEEIEPEPSISTRTRQRSGTTIKPPIRAEKHQSGLGRSKKLRRPR